MVDSTLNPVVKGPCEGYSSCSECVIAEQVDSGPDKKSCEWHPIDHYCYDYYTQSNNDIQHGISEELQCPVSSNESASSLSNMHVLVMVVPVAAVCIAAILYIVHRSALCRKWKSNRQQVNESGAAYHEGGDMEMTLTQKASVTAADMTHGFPRHAMVPVLEHDPLIDTLLERASEFGEYWRDGVCPEEMLEEWTTYYVPNLERIRDGMKGRNNDLECKCMCHDDECGWNEHNESGHRLLFPNQIVHAMVYHADGMMIFIVFHVVIFGENTLTVCFECKWFMSMFILQSTWSVLIKYSECSTTINLSSFWLRVAIWRP